MKQNIFLLLITVMLMASCATQKKAVTETQVPQTEVKTGVSAEQKYIAKVKANMPKVNNIVSKMDVTINAMGKDVSVDGKLQMRRDKLIRITLSPLGLMEVGRLEFAPDHVLLVDRINKQYVRATYNDLDFLKNNGLDFYALQAIFWNELFIPGVQTLSDSNLKSFSIDMTGTDRKVAYSKDKFKFTWTTDPATALITLFNADYAKGTANASTATCQYESFTALNGKKFPANETITFQSKAVNAKKMSLNLKMNKLTTDSSWDLETTLSSKYKQVSADEILKKLVSM